MLDEILTNFKLVLSNQYVKTGALVLIPTAISIIFLLKYKKTQKRKSYPKDVVILHQFPPGLRAPSASPFALKLETWLRMADIKYQNDYAYEFSKKGKVPFITLNDEDVADSQFCIEFLSKKFNVNFSSNFTPAENGAARAFFKMTEESLFWTMALHRFVYYPSSEASGLPWIFLKYLNGVISKRSKAQGYGLHSMDEINKITSDDLDAINDFIGDKKFLLGDKVCDADSAIFGMVAQLYYHDRTYQYKYLKDKCPNIVRYIENIKEKYWPDWNDIVREKQQ